MKPTSTMHACVARGNVSPIVSDRKIDLFEDGLTPRNPCRVAKLPLVDGVSS